MEQQILSTLRDGNKKRALELMARAWSVQLGRFCAGMVGCADAEELLQETFVIAWQELDTYRGDGSLRAWLYGIAHCLCASHLRKRDRRRGLFARFFESSEPLSASSTEECIRKNEERQLLEKALLELKPSWREAVLLYYQGQFSMQQIAEMLSVSPANARKRVSLGVAALRKSLYPVLMRPDRAQGGQNENETHQSM